MGTAGSTSPSPAGRRGSSGQGVAGSRSEDARPGRGGARAPPERGGVAAPRPCVALLARPPAGPARRAGKRERQLKPLPPPSFELFKLGFRPRPSGPGTPRRRFPPSAASAPSRPPAGSRHPTLPNPHPPPGLQRPRAPARRPAAFLRGAVPSEKEQRNGAALPLRGRVPQRPPAPARTRRPPGPAESRRRLCVGLARRLRARRAL